jgi:hypothetical protein
MESKQVLSVKINTQLYQQLKTQIGKGKISEFVEKAIVKELGEHDNKLEREQKEFLKKTELFLLNLSLSRASRHNFDRVQLSTI